MERRFRTCGDGMHMAFLGRRRQSRVEESFFGHHCSFYVPCFGGNSDRQQEQEQRKQQTAAPGDAVTLLMLESLML